MAIRAAPEARSIPRWRKRNGRRTRVGAPDHVAHIRHRRHQDIEDVSPLGPDLQLVHPLNTGPEDWEALAKHGVHYSVSPIGEAGRAGEMQFPEMLQAGVKVSISIDNVTAERCDCFACMHVMQTSNRHRTARKLKITTKELVRMATPGGAEDLGLDKVTGLFALGKRADLILVRKTNQICAV